MNALVFAGHDDTTAGKIPMKAVRVRRELT